jgi:N-terminal domain of (some) glycogen debranching enzymes
MTRMALLHELVSCVQAPTVALSGSDGQIRAGGSDGVLRYDRRVLSELVVDVDGHEPVAVGHGLSEASLGLFVGLVLHLGDPGPDPTVRLERERRVRRDGMDEKLVLVNVSTRPISALVRTTATCLVAQVGPLDDEVRLEVLSRRGLDDGGHPEVSRGARNDPSGPPIRTAGNERAEVGAVNADEPVAVSGHVISLTSATLTG